mmetsp:Transcript_135127/g.288964  ORF Transcript_135127/g.288964 Transcript_135127/m.288964 type:complete len:288 (-) Transcript_135127:190-1053(-)
MPAACGTGICTTKDWPSLNPGGTSTLKCCPLELAIVSSPPGFVPGGTVIDISNVLPQPPMTLVPPSPPLIPIPGLTVGIVRGGMGRLPTPSSATESSISESQSAEGEEGCGCCRGGKGAAPKMGPKVAANVSAMVVGPGTAAQRWPVSCGGTVALAACGLTLLQRCNNIAVLEEGIAAGTSCSSRISSSQRHACCARFFRTSSKSSRVFPSRVASSPSRRANSALSSSSLSVRSASLVLKRSASASASAKRRAKAAAASSACAVAAAAAACSATCSAASPACAALPL